MEELYWTKIHCFFDGLYVDYYQIKKIEAVLWSYGSE